MAGLLDNPYGGGLLGNRMQGGLLSGQPSFATMYPGVGMNTPPLPSASAPWYGEQPGIVARMLMGARDTLMQANQAMPWGGNDPSAIGIDPQAGTMDPSVMVPFASKVAGYATTGSLAAPGVAGGVGMGVRTALKGGKAVDMGSIRSIGDLRAAIDANGGKLYVRWSAGPKHDLKPGANSKDYQTGNYHDGLSSLELTNDLSDQQLAEWLSTYGYDRYSSSYKEPQRPHIYAGERLGTDSDAAPTIRPSKHVGDLSEDFLNFIMDENTKKRISLMQSIKSNEYALANPAPSKYLSPYSEETLARFRAELDGLGGPLPETFFQASASAPTYTTGGRF